MIFYDQWNNKRKNVPEKNSGERLVSTIGYVPAEIQIRDMILSGQRLQLSRGMYDTDTMRVFDHDKMVLDPRRKVYYDKVDIASTQQWLREKGEQIKKNTVKKKQEVDKKSGSGNKTEPENVEVPIVKENNKVKEVTPAAE